MIKIETDVEKMLKSPTYTPNRLLNYVREKAGIMRSNKLAALFGLSPSTLYDIEAKRIVLPAGIMILIMDYFPDISLQEIRKLSGLPMDFRPGKKRAKKSNEKANND